MKLLVGGSISGWSVGRLIAVVVGVLGIILPLFLIGSIVETLGAGQIMVIQSPVSGKLTFHTDPGLKGQWFGTVTKYNKRSQFWFSVSVDQGKAQDESLRVRFNDGASAHISGSIAWEMPSSIDHLTKVHTLYGSQVGVEQQLIRTVMEKVVYMTGPLMSSTESYAERRNELLTLIDEQIVNGIYATETHTVTVKDELTQQQRVKAIVRLKKDSNGQPVYADHSPLHDYGIRTSNLSINTIKYETVVEQQIAEQQKQLGQIQVAISEARRAEQAAITAEQTGKANAATARWKQEELNAKFIAEVEKDKAVAITNAEKEKRVAELARDSAQFAKEREILLGEGESERRRLVLAADNALEQKLTAYVKIAEATAKALSEYKGNLVPTIQMGGQSGTEGQNSVTSIQQLMEILLAKTAKDLALDVSAGVPVKK